MTEHAELEAAVSEAEKNLAEARARAAHKEFPKFIEPHASHVVKREAPHGEAPPHVSVPAFTEHHVDREGKITVLVRDAEEEAKALAEAVKEAVQDNGSKLPEAV